MFSEQNDPGNLSSLTYPCTYACENAYVEKEGITWKKKNARKWKFSDSLKHFKANNHSN